MADGVGVLIPAISAIYSGVFTKKKKQSTLVSISIPIWCGYDMELKWEIQLIQSLRVLLSSLICSVGERIWKATSRQRPKRRR